MSSTTIGIKVDYALRDRLRLAAEQIGRSPHWLHKQAVLAYVEAIERGVIPTELKYLQAAQSTEEDAVLVDMQAPFYAFMQDIQPQSVLRAAITAAYRRPEPECVAMLINQARTSDPDRVAKIATQLVGALRKKRKSGGIENLIHEFSLSSQEGVALMCLAEALLRIPDKATRDALIRDKIAKGDWRTHAGETASVFLNAATWGLMLTGKLVSVNSEKSLSSALTRLIAKGGEPLVRQGVNTAMRLMGEQFVTGQTISAALAHSKKQEDQGFTYSYDMLGEAATTDEDAEAYFLAYEQAINAIGKSAQGRGIYAGPGISIKLSALHPRYARAQRDRVIHELYPRLLELVQLAMFYDVGINIDAEEADRLELSLDLLERLCLEPALRAWNGIGFVVQAYQKRAPYVIDYIIDLAKRTQRRIMLRLVKGAYWDSEIKRAQVNGLEDYPVYTRKVHTDISYLACARQLLQVPESIFPQFATHNAHTLAAIYVMAGKNYYPGQYEFQCLHGMGEGLYEAVVAGISAEHQGLARPCRIYAPVGSHETLLAYLVRRLLENGANTSFVNQVGDDSIAIQTLIKDPVVQAEQISPLGKPHEKIPLPRYLYASQSSRLNAAGLDLSNEHRLGSLAATLSKTIEPVLQAMPILAQAVSSDLPWLPVRNPANQFDVVGQVRYSSELEVQAALETAAHTASIWQATPVAERSQCLIKAAQLLEEKMPICIGILIREAGKSYANAIAEVREAVDFLRYYALEAEQNLTNDQHLPLGTVLCISPWNFPLAIFLGQVSAALAAGNVVLAKPAEQTNLIAYFAVTLLHQAGVSVGALQLLPGEGQQIGPTLVNSPVVQGVLFTGSTAVAKRISQQLAQRLNTSGQAIPLVAETGGLNAMVVDSSALAEQVVADVMESAFDSAGQRCSALRLLCVQNDCADRLIHMLKGAVAELCVANPDLLSTDVGPVIDLEALNLIQTHITQMQTKGFKLTQSELDPACRQGTFIAPTIIEINQVADLSQEVFGPVLHVLRFERAQLDQLINDINQSGYGLTFGVHSRIDETIQRITDRIKVGNIYVNRNIVGAIVGVQPFGGRGLSGTGPKAGGPLYLKRLLASAPNDAVTISHQQLPLVLAGPTGELNTYGLQPKGQVLCIATTSAGIEAQLMACTVTQNSMLLYNNAVALAWFQARTELSSDSSAICLVEDTQLDSQLLDFQSVLFEGDSDVLQQWNQRLSQRDGPIVAVQGLSTQDITDGNAYRTEQLVYEISISVNTAAAGGNASLMMIG